MVQWGFNKKSIDEPLVGGAEQYAISRKVHNFVREAIQNCWDQRLSEFEPVKVTFNFVELEGEELASFLNDVKWTEGLKEHLEACSTQNNHDKPKLRRNLEKFNKGKIRILQVSDSNTKGLSGPEFGDQGNFSKLCRNKMTPSEGGGSAARGGAFGVGKSVYWSFSGLNTVVFSSIYTDEHGNEKSRVFGRTYLPDHHVVDGNGESSIFSGDAYLCVRDTKDLRVSMDYATAGLSGSSLLNRQPGDFGTTITLLMYEEVETEDEASLADTAAKFRDAIIANFWPLLASQPFEATVEWKSRGGSGSELVGIPEEFDPFVRALKQSQNDDAIKGKSEPSLLEPGETAFFLGDIKIPARKDEEYPREAVSDGQVAACVTRLTEEEKQKLAQFEERYKDMKFLNRLSNVRGPHMVVAALITLAWCALVVSEIWMDNHLRMMKALNNSCETVNHQLTTVGSSATKFETCTSLTAQLCRICLQMFQGRPGKFFVRFSKGTKNDQMVLQIFWQVNQQPQSVRHHRHQQRDFNIARR
jgi:hypothetical protein